MIVNILQMSNFATRKHLNHSNIYTSNPSKRINKLSFKPVI